MPAPLVEQALPADAQPTTTEKKPKTTPKQGVNGTTEIERRGLIYAQRIEKYLRQSGGQFVRDGDGSFHIILRDQRIPLTYDRTNYPLAGLMLEACKASSLSPAAHVAIQRLIVEAAKQASTVHMRRFSAMSHDGERLYVPVQGGGLLQITANQVTVVPNARNQDSIWVEHPRNEPLKYTTADPKDGLERFERLVVETQACRVPEMRWLVAINNTLYPYVRDLSPARFILIAIGKSQQGKTSGQQRFTLLHGLGEVMGDYTVAALGNLPDPGLLVIDNKEQANFTQPLIDFCLFLATGAQRGRSNSDGKIRVSGSRPVAVITSIEGVFKDELRKRSVEVGYEVSDGQHARRWSIESEIQQHRHVIGSALMMVLQRYLTISKERRPTPNPIPQFEEHFTFLCDLLRAYGEVAGRPPEWAESIIGVWATTIQQQDADENESELEQPLLRVLDEARNGAYEGDFAEMHLTYKGQHGSLLVAECAAVLTAIQRLQLRDRDLPRTANGLSRRLRSNTFKSFQVLDANIAPELPDLKRTARKRPIGFFVPDDGDDGE